MGATGAFSQPTQPVSTERPVVQLVQTLTVEPSIGVMRRYRIGKISLMSLGQETYRVRLPQPDERGRLPACISNHTTAEARDTTAMTSLRLLAVLNVLSSTPARAKRLAPFSSARLAPSPDGPLTHFTLPRGEKCRLTLHLMFVIALVLLAAPPASAQDRGAGPDSPSPVSASAPAATEEQENLFWQSIMNSTNPAEYEAYIEQFPNGVFRVLAQIRLSELRGTGGDPPAVEARLSASPAPDSRVAAGGEGHQKPGEMFRDCDECPEMVVMPGGRLALGRYEVTVGEYRAFASATGGGAGGGCFSIVQGDSWRDPGFRQTDRHPVTCVSWNDAQEYVSWLSQTTGGTYRLPTEDEWGRAAAGSPRGCRNRGIHGGTCPVGSYGANGVALSDMVGNLWEWTEDCWEGNCGRRVLRGGSWVSYGGFLRPGARIWDRAALRISSFGFRVAKTLD